MTWPDPSNTRSWVPRAPSSWVIDGSGSASVDHPPAVARSSHRATPPRQPRAYRRCGGSPMGSFVQKHVPGESSPAVLGGPGPQLTPDPSLGIDPNLVGNQGCLELWLPE